MNRREKLILNTLANVEDPQEAKNLDTTLRLVLGDMGEQYCDSGSGWDLACSSSHPKRGRHCSTKLLRIYTEL